MKPFENYYLAKRNMLPDAQHRFRIIGKIKPGMRIHVSAVCGKAMASVACMLQDFGCIVSGSDAVFNLPMSAVLDNHKIKKLSPSKSNLRNIDVLVVGNTLSHSAEEVLEARKRNIPMISGAEAVAEVSKGKRSLVVAGTHGKTTTSAMLTHIFLDSGKDPAYMIGGMFQNGYDSYGLGSKKSKHIIYEGDEYNCAYFDRAPKFLRYNPTSVLLTSIEHDHFDLYPSFPDYVQAFQFLVDDLPKQGFLVVHESAVPHLDLKNCKSKVYVYGKGKKCDVRYSDIKVTSKGSVFKVTMKGVSKPIQVVIPMYGEYNIANTTGALALSILEKVPIEKIVKALEVFPGTKERQELLGTTKENVTVIRDYAHHPTAVTLTLEGLRLRYPKRRILAVFQPMSATSRKRIFETDYAVAFEHANGAIIVTPELKPNESSNEIINTSSIVKHLRSKNREAYATKDCNDALKIITKISKKNDVVVFMSSWNMDSIPKKFLEN